MTFDEFKKEVNFTAEDERLYKIQKKRNLAKRNLYKILKDNLFGLTIISLLSFGLLPIYLYISVPLVTLILGLITNSKYMFYKHVVYVNELTMEDHYDFLKTLIDDK